MKAEILLTELKGDVLTPISILQKISGPKKFLLESSHKYNDSGRYSFIGSDPVYEFITHGDETKWVHRDGNAEFFKGNPLETLKNVLPVRKEPELPFPFAGGAVGYIGYDIIRQFEDIGDITEDELKMPDIHLMFYETIIVFDHLQEKVSVVSTSFLQDTEREKIFQRRVKELKQPLVFEEETQFTLSGFEAGITKETYMKNVETAKEYIKSGDIFQVVLSQRMKSEFAGEPLSLYRKHRANNPTPYMFYIEFAGYTVIGSSPESLIKTRGDKVYVNPIAGTKKRGKNKEEDHQIEKSLLADEKELAEHKMLVDLGRNDLGRVCDFGTVSLEKYMAVEKYRHVMHLVSEVNGVLRQGKHPVDALAACLPAGTVSGAPKIRAMEIISELENTKRGLYSGAIGYISSTGSLDFALAIRTMILKDQKAYIQAGAGIVYDSIPESEYEETLNKLRSFLEGVQ